MLFEVSHLSTVTGLRLSNGREVVVKARPPVERIRGCVQVQRHLWDAGFPCPEPLAGPHQLGGLSATSEVYVPGGALLEPGPDSPQLFAKALATLVRLAPAPATVATLDPPPAWVGWDHGQSGVWPFPDDLDADLNKHPGPAWLDEVAERARHRLQAHALPHVTGHADWESQNIRWLDRRLRVVHDWDSVVSLPEAAIVGVAAAIFPTSDEQAASSTEETEAFLRAYEQTRRRVWSAIEWKVCWAAGLWIRAYNTKKEIFKGSSPTLLGSLARQADDLLRLAGV